MPRAKRKNKPVHVAFRPKKVTLELTTKHTHRIFSIEKPITKFVDLKENPDRIMLGSMERGYVKVFSYKTNPERAYLSIGDDFLGLDLFTYPKLVSLLTKTAWFCGWYGKRAKKYKYNPVKRRYTDTYNRTGK